MTTRRATPTASRYVPPPPPAATPGTPPDARGAHGEDDALPRRRGGRRARAARLPAPVVLIGLLAVAAVWTLLLYRPWEQAPVSLLDFSEFLPLLKRNATFASRLGAFLHYYGSQGRFNLLQYVWLVTKWAMFGDDAVAWQLMRTAQMLAIFGGVVALLRALGRGLGAAACGAALLVVSTPAVSAFTRLTMGEPLGVCFILAGALLATRYQRAERWPAHALAICVALAGAILTKEMLLLAAPFVVLVAWLYQGDGAWDALPARTRRNGVLLAAVAATIGALAVPVLYTLKHATAGGFGSGYGTTALTAHTLLHNLERFTLPFSSARLSLWGPLLVPANAIYAAVVLAGLATAVRRRRGARAAVVVPWVVAASLPLVAALLYWPWPDVEDFYVLPCLIGSALTLALAVDALVASGWSIVGRLALACAGAFVFLTSSQRAYDEAQSELAIRLVDGRMARLLASAPPSQVALLAKRPDGIRRAPAKQWMMRGPTLSRYAAATAGHRVPLMVEVTCDEAAAILRASTPIVVSYGGACAFDRPPSFGVRAGVQQWNGLHRESGVLGADVWWPAALNGGGRSAQ